MHHFVPFLDCGTFCGVVASEVRDVANQYNAAGQLVMSAYTLDTVPRPTSLQYTRYYRAERYRYDALGRRVWQQMIRDASCPHHDPSSGCRNEVTRTVWAGDQVLYEIRQLADTIGGASESDGATSLYTGVVGYTHAGGIDAPLALFKGTQLAVLYTNWEGTYDRATCPVAGATTPAPCDALTPYFPMTGGTVYGEAPDLPNGPPSWYGSVITGMTDGSGYQYRRNRYYDPKSGRFTTEDPIGLAGGLNAYGYAGGDPVNYADPFGLCKDRKNQDVPCPDKGKVVKWLQENALKRPSGKCARYCREGLEAGGFDAEGRPVAAGDYGPFLVARGAGVVPEQNYQPEAGDIAVFAATATHEFGHIQVYDGKQWISDFKQNGFIPYRDQSSAGAHTIYRFPGTLPPVVVHPDTP